MPRADEPRVTVRFGRVEYAALVEVARARGVKVGALVREAALESVLSGDTHSEAAVVPARSAAASPRGASRPSAPSRASSGPVRLDSVAQVRLWAGERQARLNAAKERGR